jgi:hypothetical protein
MRGPVLRCTDESVTLSQQQRRRAPAQPVQPRHAKPRELLSVPTTAAILASGSGRNPLGTGSGRGDVLAQQGQRDAALAGLEAMHGTLPVRPSGSSSVKVFPTAFLGPPASVAGRKSPAHGGIPPRLPGSVKSAAVPGVRVPSAERSAAALRKVAMFNDAISRRPHSRIGSVLDLALSIH